jgi:hypothetical protein
MSFLQCITLRILHMTWMEDKWYSLQGLCNDFTWLG